MAKKTPKEFSRLTAEVPAPQRTWDADTTSDHKGVPARNRLRMPSVKRRHCGTNLMAEVKSQVNCCFLYEPLACE